MEGLNPVSHRRCSAIAVFSCYFCCCCVYLQAELRTHTNLPYINSPNCIHLLLHIYALLLYIIEVMNFSLCSVPPFFRYSRGNKKDKKCASSATKWNIWTKKNKSIECADPPRINLCFVFISILLLLFSFIRWVAC